MTDPLIQNIQRRIDQAGYPNMQAFAEKSGIRAETLTKWLQGKSRPSKKSLEKLAAVLECRLEDFTQDAVEAPSAAETDQTIVRLERLVELQNRLIEKLERLLERR